MAQYDLEPRTFLTPREHPVTVFLRAESNDFNTAFSALNEDEYQLRDRYLSGLALDIGGHIGTVTLALAVDNPDLRVIVVEPIPENLSLLRQNLEANGVEDRVQIVAGLVGPPGPGTIRYAFKGSEAALHHAFIGNSTFAVPEGEHQAMKTWSWSLEQLIGDQEVTFLKCDCEGGEYGLLTEGRSRIPQFREIAMEWHPNAPDHGHHTRQEIVELLSPTHRLTFSGPEAGPGGVQAVRR